MMLPAGEAGLGVAGFGPGAAAGHIDAAPTLAGDDPARPSAADQQALAAPAGGEAERGAAALLMLALAAAAVVAGLLVVDLAAFLVARARAQAAADAAALAAAPVTFREFGATGTAAAEAARFASANGAELMECRCRRDRSWRSRTVVVRVRVPLDFLLLRDAAATAWSSAVFEPTRLAGP